MLFEWFNTKEFVVYAESVAAEITAVIPADAVGTKRLNAPKAQKKLLSIANRTEIFLKGRPINFYKKAKFLNALKWHLKDAGHTDLLIDEVIGFFVPLLR